MKTLDRESKTKGQTIPKPVPVQIFKEHLKMLHLRPARPMSRPRRGAANGTLDTLNYP